MYRHANGFKFAIGQISTEGKEQPTIALTHSRKYQSTQHSGQSRAGTQQMLG